MYISHGRHTRMHRTQTQTTNTPKRFRKKPVLVKIPETETPQIAPVRIQSSKTKDTHYLHSQWTYGQIEIIKIPHPINSNSNHRKNLVRPYKPHKVEYNIYPKYVFFTVEEAWRVIGDTLLNTEFKMCEPKSDISNEIYFFRADIPPHREDAREKTYTNHWNEACERVHLKPIHEVVIYFKHDNIKSESAPIESSILLILLMIGETFVSDSDSEDIIGIIVKPTERGGTTRIWTRNAGLVPDIKSKTTSVLRSNHVGHTIGVNILDFTTDKSY